MAGRWRGCLAHPTGELRDELLALNGVGPETADSILLYAGNHPVFVVDAYTRRILERHQIVPGAAGYDEIRLLFEQALGETSPPKRSLEGAPSTLGPRGSCHPPFAGEHSRAHPSGSGVQRNARADRRGWQALLSKVTTAV
jgi:hypothetical protein